jgi:dienelactone hydrolase
MVAALVPAVFAAPNTLATATYKFTDISGLEVTLTDVADHYKYDGKAPSGPTYTFYLDSKGTAKFNKDVTLFGAYSKDYPTESAPIAAGTALTIEGTKIDANTGIWTPKFAVSAIHFKLEPLANYSEATATEVLVGDSLLPAPAPAPEDESPFTDVAKDAKYYDAVVWATENGYVNGIGDGKFDPSGALNRGDFVTVLYRYAGKPKVANAPTFADVPAGEYYADAVAWAVNAKITNGTSTTTFSPKEALTLWQLDVMLQRYAAGKTDGIDSTKPKTVALRSDIVVALKDFADGKVTEPEKKPEPTSGTKIAAVILGMSTASAPAIIDGEYMTLTFSGGAVATLTAQSGYLTKIPGVYELTLDDKGVATSIGNNWDKVKTGYTVAPAKDGKITLGVKDTVYNVAAGAVAYNLKGTATTYKVDITAVPADKAAAYWVTFDESGAVTALYYSAGSLSADGLKLYDNAKKFDTAWGPVDAKSGLKNEYLYYKPAEKAGTKYPLVIWLHGSGFSDTTWSPLLAVNNAANPNDIANWASDDYQKLFTAGGAYIFTPRANADLGTSLRWGDAQDTQVGSFYAALDDFIAKNPDIDTKKIYIGGFSVGGGMTWLALQERPDFFAAAFPAAATDRHIPSATDIVKYASTPIWSIYGAGDTVIPVAAQKAKLDALYAAADKAGVDSRLTILGAGYTLPDGTKSNYDHREWMAFTNNLKYNDGKLYQDQDGKAVESTLIEWLNEQSE